MKREVTVDGAGEAGPGGLTGFCDRHFRLLACAVLAVVLFNLAFRIEHEIVMEWDESLYAVSAWEMVKSGNWVATTFLGQLDYYNTKPPLNVWLIALCFKTFGIGLVSLRLTTVVSAWLTVAVLVLWVRRAADSAAALLSGVVLGTCFAYFYVHSGRTANTDALFTLIFVLVGVTLWASDRRPWQAAWLGPLLAAAFLLRGTAALMAVVLVAGFWACRPAALRGRWKALGVAAVLFAVPVAAWVIARWQIDQDRFFRGMIGYDLLARTARPLEGHERSWFFYPYLLAKHQYDWLLAAFVAVLVAPGWYRRIGPVLRAWRRDAFTTALSVSAVVAMAVPTVMRTKVPWYLNTFYPVFAVGVAVLLTRSFPAALARSRLRAALLVGVALIALAAAESKLMWYSYHYRELSLSPQGVLLGARERLVGRRVFRSRWNRAEMFVLGGIIGAERGLAAGVDDFLARSRPGDYFMIRRDVHHPALSLVATNGRSRLYRRAY